MGIAITAAQAEGQLNPAAIQEMIGAIPIPPRPEVVHQIQTELGKAEPNIRNISNIVSQDIGLTVAVLKVVNSPMFALARKATSVEQAVGLIGLRHMAILVTGLSMRGVLRGDSNMLARFFDTSAKRSYAMSQMAKGTKTVDVGLAQMFGLFCDVGITLLRSRFPNYIDTLKTANADLDRSFTQIEQDAHNTDHALIGAMMAKSWDLPQTVVLAIRLHHDYQVFMDPKIPRDVSRLIALGLVAEVAIQRFGRLHSNVEWTKGGDYVAGALVLSPDDIEEWIEQIVEDFAIGID